MRKFVIENPLLMLPFNEPASALSVLMNGEKLAPLAVHLAEVVESVIGPTPEEMKLGKIDDLEERLIERYNLDAKDKIVAYRDDLYFDREFFTYFLKEAQRAGVPCRAALTAKDPAWDTYSIPLSSLVWEADDYGGFYPLELYYFPQGWQPRSEWKIIPIPSGAAEKGYYGIPDSMTNPKLETSADGSRQDLTYYLTERSCVPIQSWVHIFNANVPLGIFSRGYRFEEAISKQNLLTFRLLFRAILEQKQFVSCSEIVKVGKNSDIDPSAIILGPCTIGDNVTIGAGTVIDNCVIGDNVNIAQNCHLVLSLVGDNCFLPFRASLFMTTLMEYTIVAQNTCLQMCVIGRNSFIGAGSTFTDFNLLPSPLKALNAYGELGDVGQAVIGGCVGHNVRIGSGMVVMPARMIESDVILVASPERRVIGKSITYEMSDHHTYEARISALHQRLYPRRITMDEDQMLEDW